MRRHLPTLAVLVVVLSLAGCEPAPVVDVEDGSPFTAAALTRDGSDRYVLTGDLEAATITAPEANVAGNTRITFTTDEATTVDHGACATFTTASADVNQQGLMVRWDGTRGVTATKNVWGGINTVVNVHTWDTTSSQPFTLVAQFPLTGLGYGTGNPAPLPWRMCLSASGANVAFKVWPTSSPEPVDGNPCCTGSATVALTAPGRPGWYVGHLHPGDSVTYTDLTTDVAG